MTNPHGLRAIPANDRAWLLAALADALAGGAPIMPLAPGIDPADPAVLRLRRQPLPADTAVVLRTSGSTGVAKAVALSAAQLTASAQASNAALGGQGQWLVTLPLHLISGLQMLTRSLLSGTQAVFLPAASAAADSGTAGILAAAREMRHAQRYISLVPVQLARLLDAAEQDPLAAETLQSFAAVLVGGQALPVSLRARAAQLGVQLRRSYGMTESCGGCVYDGVAIGDTRVRIRDGQVQLAGQVLALGYVADPAADAANFSVESTAVGQSTRWYHTGDAGELLGGMLQVTGRLDRVFISGGVNVSLDEIETVVQAQPGWDSAVAIAMPHSAWGERAMLFVEGAIPGGFNAVQRAVRETLGSAAVPLRARGVPQLPRLLGGKVHLQALTAMAEAESLEN